MKTSYNLIAGQSVERLAALSDGVFAVAMTLLVLDLRAPAMEAIHSDHDLWRAMAALGPRLLMYGMSFMMLGIFWVGQQTLLNHLRRSDRALPGSPSRSPRFRPRYWPSSRLSASLCWPIGSISWSWARRCTSVGCARSGPGW